MKEINPEELLDQCWAMLNRKYEEVYGVKNYGYNRPYFRWIFSHDQLMALRKYAARSNVVANVYEIKGGCVETLFGHPIREQRRTPYLEAILNPND